jgi:hypothetical protein
MGQKGLQTAKATLRKKNNEGELTLSDLIAYYK